MAFGTQDEICYFARTNHRGGGKPFGIKHADRLAHIYIIGKTGVGKSTLLETMASQDLKSGRGFALIDPHGDLVQRLAGEAQGISRDIIYLNAAEPRQPYGYNPLRRVRDDKIALAVSGFLETLRKLWPDAWGVRMEHVLRNSLFALLEQDAATLPDILRLYSDTDYRKSIARHVRNETVRRFWQYEFEELHPRQRAEMVAPIQNKLGALLSDPTLCRILVKPTKDVRFRTLMDQGGVFLANLAKGEIGEDSATTLGSFLVSTMALAAFSRASAPPQDRAPFYIYIDEWQNFTTQMFANVMAELRKYGVGLTVANQYLHQLAPDIRQAVLGNAGTLIAFRVGAEDAQVLAREMRHRFDVADLTSLPNGDLYVKLMIDGAPSPPFSGSVLRPWEQAPTDTALPPMAAPVRKHRDSDFF